MYGWQPGLALATPPAIDSLFDFLMLVSGFPVEFLNPEFCTSNLSHVTEQEWNLERFWQDGSKRWLRWLQDLKPELALRTWSSERTKTGSH